MEFIPHQLHLTPDQAKKLISGVVAQIPFAQMGADKGEHIMHLLPETAMKLLGAYKKGKGIRMKLSKEEIDETRKSGKGFFDSLVKGASQFASSPLGQKIMDKALDRGLEYALGGGLYAGAVAGMPRPVVKTAGALGKRPPKGSPEMKEYMAKMRELRGSKGSKKGGDILGDIGKAINSPLGQKITDKALDAVLRHAFGGAVGEGIPFFDNIGRAFTSAFNQPPRSQAEKDALSFVLNTFEPAVIKPLSVVAPPVGDVMQLQNEALKSKYGVGMHRKGKGVKQSKAYKKAMLMNVGVVPATVEDNKPVSAFKTNPKVKASSDEMSLSPYQSITSPAMNPFVPRSSVQAGGTGCGLF